VTGPPAATAAVRVAVRRALQDLAGPVAAAVSGGADSLALAAALAFERPGAGALVVDHGLQPGSADVAARAADQCRSLGLDAVVLPASARSSEAPQRRGAEGLPKIFAGAGGPASAGGPEATARALRYAALDRAAAARGLQAVLLGHTLDDQAETVLLGLVRGSGARALAGMAAVRGRYRRPPLEVDRATTRAACAEAGLQPWQDPHNEDPAYARVRVRTAVLPVLEQQLGPAVAVALARTARQLREDADALDELTPDTDDVAVLQALPAALRARALKRWAERVCGSPVTGAHVDALRALVDDWHGQGPVSLPGGVRVRREGPRLASAP
jgi:tRNA(Ile)-lysidine synthase